MEIDSFYKSIKKINLKEFIINLKVTFICFFILRICIFLFFGSIEFFAMRLIIRIFLYAVLFAGSFVMVYFYRNFILLLLNFMISILLGMVGPLINFFSIYKLLVNFILYPTIFVFWFVRMHPIAFILINFVLLAISLQFIWLVFMLLFVVYVYEIILNPFYPFKQDIFEALEFYSLEINVVIKRLQNKTLPRPSMLGVNINKIFEIHKNLNIQHCYEDIVILERTGYGFIILNYIFKKLKFAVILPESQSVYFLNFFYYHEFLILYFLVARFYYFDSFFRIRELHE